MDFLRNKSVLWTLGSLFLILSAVRIGTADLISSYTGDEITLLSTNGKLPAAEDLDRISNLLENAKFIAPGNPDIYENLARVALMRSGFKEQNEAQRNALLSEGVELTRVAISLRPASSYGWAMLLLFKRERAEFDAEFRRALERSVTLGPWEPGVQPIVADVGLSAWSALPFAEQEMVRANFARGMKRQANVMLDIVRAHSNDCSGIRAKLNAGCPR
jgi:hypothetical protein